MKVICMNFLDPDLFFQFLKGRCHSNRFWAKFAKWPLFNTLAFPNGFDYRNFDSKTFNGNIFSISSLYLLYILCKFDQDWSSNPRDYEGTIYTFWKKRHKSAFRTKYISTYGIDRNHNFSAGRQMYADYKTKNFFAIIKGTLLWINFGAFLQTSNSKLTVFTLCSGISKQNATSFCKCAD